MFTVQDAVALARRAHEGQVDKAGMPYIDHPLRVMAGVTGEREQMVAVLHDTVEDTWVTAEHLAEAGCPPEVIEAVLAISHRPGEPQADYLTRVAANPLALVVKHADIADNSSRARIDRLEPKTQERLKLKYANALRILAELEAGSTEVR